MVKYSGMDNYIKKNFGILSTCMIILVILVSVMFGFRKQGFYIDEYGSFTVANGTQLGIDITPGKWTDTSEFLSELTSQGEESFRFRQTYETAMIDVHPPLYFFLLHLLSSFFPGIFNKWIGISLNLCLLIPILLLVRNIALKLSGENKIIAIVTMALFGLSPATISMVMMVRMYMLLTLWTLLYAYLCVSDLERDKLSVTRFLLPVFICGFCGFMTQYFFVIPMFFLTFVYAFYLFFSCRRIKDALIFGFTALLSLIATYFVWSISYYHIFKGYRGEEAFSNIMDISVWRSRLITHYDYLNRMVFGELLPLFAIIALTGAVLIIRHCVVLYKGGRTPVLCSLSYSTRGMIMLLISSVLTFFVLAQVGILDGLTSIRHYYSAYALFLVIIPSGAFKVLHCFLYKKPHTTLIVTSLLVLAIIFSGFIGNRVIFLYERDKAIADFINEHPQTKTVMIENGGWDAATLQLLLSPEVYFIRVCDPSTEDDERIANADDLLVYVNKWDEMDSDYLDIIYRQNKNLSNAERIWVGDVYSAYYLY